MLGNTQTWTEVFGNLIIVIGVVGVAWALAWASVHNTKSDPFWNRKRINDEDE